MSDFLVERPGGQYFDLVPRSDGEYGITAALTSQRLADLLRETGLEDSLLTTYISQLAIHTVNADLLYTEGSTLIADLDTMLNRTRMVECDEDDNDGFYQKAAIPEDHQIWSALRGYSGLQILDRNGYKDFNLFAHPLSGLNSLEIHPPETPAASFIRPIPIANPFDGLMEAVDAIEGLRGDSNVTHFMEQHQVIRDKHGRAVAVSAEDHLIVGRATKLGEFVAYAALIGPFTYMK
jgi:hypothetical protein